MQAKARRKFPPPVNVQSKENEDVYLRKNKRQNTALSNINAKEVLPMVLISWLSVTTHSDTFKEE